MKRTTADVSSIMDRLKQLCKTRGLRLTHQRAEILRILLERTNHPTTDEVYREVRKHIDTISLDTVYRTLAIFEEYELIRRVHHIDNTTRYDVNISNHHHLVCTKCNRIEDFTWPDFDRLKLPGSITHWGQTNAKHAVINGLCSRCKK